MTANELYKPKCKIKMFNILACSSHLAYLTSSTPNS